MEIGSRLELFVDTALIERLDGLALRMHSPQPAAVSPSAVQGHYVTVIKDGDLYRAYYRDWAIGAEGSGDNGGPDAITCYAESRDGHNWTYPQLGLFDVHGARGNNVILAGEPPCSHNFSPFLDTRQGVPVGERYKALAGRLYDGQGGLYGFQSADGIQWTKIQPDPMIRSTRRAFDSQNVTFWSESEGVYLCYYRDWRGPNDGLRAIARTTSPDFIHWSEASPVEANLPGEHLYTSNTHPYFRAPHIYIALPTRFLPDRGNSTDILLMTSRGGARFDRQFREAFLRPGLDIDSWGERANYVALNVVPTGAAEMSLYHAPTGRRYVLRTDGFASVHGDCAGGEMVTKAFRFSGDRLLLNCSTSAAGSIGVEVQSPEGRPVPGYRLSDCMPIVGDEIERTVHWRTGSSVAGLAGKSVRLRYVLEDADLYSMRFGPSG